MARSWAAYILPVVVIAGGVAVYWHKEGGARPSPEAARAEQAVGLLEGLKPGDTIEQWAVTKMFVSQSHTGKPQLSVELTSGDVGLTIWIARKENADKPPTTTERYALSYGDQRPLGAAVPQPVIDKIVTALAERVRRNEHTAPVPGGL